MEASFDGLRSQLTRAGRGSWHIVPTNLLILSRRDPEETRPYVLRDDWPGYGPARAYSRSSTEEDGCPHNSHPAAHEPTCGINKAGWIAWTSVPLRSGAIANATYSCVEPGDTESLFVLLNA